MAKSGRWRLLPAPARAWAAKRVNHRDGHTISVVGCDELLPVSQPSAASPRTTSMMSRALWKMTRLASRVLSLMLHAEAEASGGDPLQLTNLFGISDPTAIRYCTGTGTMDPSIDHSAIRTGR